VQSVRLRQMMLSNRLSAVGLIIVVVVVGAAILYSVLGPRVTPYDPGAPNLAAANLPPSLAHFFGTDFEGRDIFSRVIAALPIDIGIPITVVLFSATLGILLGVVAGYRGGLTDEVIMRITDLFLAFPTIIMVLAIAATLGPSLLNATLAVFFVWWPPYVRLVRGGVLEVSTEDFISISKSLNSSFFYIMRRGILPNVIPTIITYATLDVGTALLSVSILGYLGVGIPVGTPELGVMVGSITYNLYTFPLEALLPAFATMVIVAGFSFLGEGAREAGDVKVRPHILFRGSGLERAHATASPAVASGADSRSGGGPGGSTRSAAADHGPD
jgi:peptide/nickel transport system permease protein